MIPVVCRVKHDPENGTYGDCVRACIASVMELDAEAVPHFFHDDPPGLVANHRIREWLRSHKLAPFWVHYPAEMKLEDILAIMAELNTGVPLIVYGACEGGGDHVVICQDGKMTHNPSWLGGSLTGPGSHGYWTVLVLARI